MENLLKNSKHEKLAMTALFFLLYLVAFGLMMFPHYALDTFDYYRYDGYNYHLVNGRVASYLLGALLAGIDFYKMTWLSSLVSIIFLTASSMIIYSKISNVFGKKSLIVAGSVAILFCNPFVVDGFRYPETCYLAMLSLLFTSMALIPIKKKISLKNFLLSFALLFIGLSFYQPALGYYVGVSLALVYIFHEGKLTRGGGGKRKCKSFKRRCFSFGFYSF